LRIIGAKKPPTGGVGVTHLTAASQPRLLGRPKFRLDWLNVSDETQQESKIDPLVVGHVVYRHRTGLQQDCAQRLGTGILP